MYCPSLQYQRNGKQKLQIHNVNMRQDVGSWCVKAHMELFTPATRGINSMTERICGRTPKVSDAEIYVLFLIFQDFILWQRVQTFPWVRRNRNGKILYTREATPVAIRLFPLHSHHYSPGFHLLSPVPCRSLLTSILPSFPILLLTILQSINSLFKSHYYVFQFLTLMIFPLNWLLITSLALHQMSSS